MDLFKTLPALTNNMLGQSIRNNDRDEVAVSFSLHRECLSKTEGDRIWKVSSLPGRAFLLGRLGFRRGSGSFSSSLAFGSLRRTEGGRLGVFLRTQVSGSDCGACRGLDAVETVL